ncbi:MAG TPA: hypothetical protein VJP88_04140 [Caulobacteraceae bacterium]|nr:hypothetical protein [Caulobacteraceae bacterium]
MTHYPDAPGHKARDTAKAAADLIAPRERSLRARVYDEIAKRPGTPEDIAERLGEAVHSIRPRCSQLAAAGLIEDSGQRGDAMGGRKAIIWRVTNAA